MHRWSWLLVVVLISCLAMTMGCGKKQASVSLDLEGALNAHSKAVDETVKDPDAARALKNGAIAVDYTLRKFQEDTWNLKVTAFYLHADYDTTPEAFDEYMEAVKEARNKLRREITEAALRSRTLISKEEWTALHKALTDEFEQH